MKRALVNLGSMLAAQTRRLVLFLAAVCCLQQAYAQNFERLTDIEADAFGDYAVINGDYQTLKNVRRYWTQEAQRLKSIKGMEFALTGNSEAVFRVTIPARLLFVQNDSTLLASADGVLRPLLRLCKGSDAVAKVIVTSYTDNNGSDKYLYAVSGSRARQVHRWFAKQGVGPSDVRSHGFGNKVPRTLNETIAQREKNRRVSIFFVPNRKMLKAAKNNKL